MTGIINPTRVELIECTINDVPFGDGRFYVQKICIYEDICKFYFTGTLVIETAQNFGAALLAPLSPVRIKIRAERTGGEGIVREEFFRIYSYDSKSLNVTADGRIQHTINLISQEYYKDRNSSVQTSFSNSPGTVAIQEIHDKYIKTDPKYPLRIVMPSSGMLAKSTVPHLVRDLKPVKAIHDILDKIVYAQYKTGAPTYYKDAFGHVVAPLEFLMKQGPTNKNTFLHKLAAGSNLIDTLEGYELISEFRPISPSAESTAAASAQLASVLTTSQYSDSKTMNTKSIPANLSDLLKTFQSKGNAQLTRRIQEMLESGLFGGKTIFNIIDTLQQDLQITKNGPGKYAQTEESFIASLGFAEKFRVVVPAQSGLPITCGKTIRVKFLVGDRLNTKNLFIPRLIHEFNFFTVDGNSSPKATAVQGLTDMYCVLWQ